MSKQIKDYNQVTTPALTDLLVCMQADNKTYKQTVNQVFSNVNNLTASSALDGTEVVLIWTGGSNKKVSTSVLADYIIESA